MGTGGGGTAGSAGSGPGESGSGGEVSEGGSGGDDPSAGCEDDPPECLRIPEVEKELLSLINEERQAYDPPRPKLKRDPGMDRIILWHVSRMAEEHFLSHNDSEGRESEGRAHYYGDDPAVRCSEIIQYWGGTPSGKVHYDGYFASPSHHSGYLEEDPYNLGPTSWAGVAAVAGTGPTGSPFDGRDGSYTGVMFCEQPVKLEIDPFSE
jgi:hypothetical protein